MFTVYILYSPAIDRYYIGQTEDFEARYAWHKVKLFPESYTAQTEDWIIFFQLNCESRGQAVNIENHIKRMKSRKYIENLKKYPEIGERLKLKYQ